jgi:hypothetical protein
VLEDVLAVHGKALFISDGGLKAEILLFLAPRDGERVVGPQSNRRNVQVSMLARSETPRASHANVDTERITGKNLNVTISATVADVVHNEATKTHASLGDPEGEHTVQHKLLRAALEMHPYSAKSESSTHNVAVQKDLIEGVADWGWRLDQEEDKRDRTLTEC